MLLSDGPDNFLPSQRRLRMLLQLCASPAKLFLLPIMDGYILRHTGEIIRQITDELQLLGRRRL